MTFGRLATLYARHQGIDGDYSRVNLYLAIQCVDKKLDPEQFQNEFNNYKTIASDETYKSESYPSCSFYVTKNQESSRAIDMTADLRDIKLAIFCSNGEDSRDFNEMERTIEVIKGTGHTPFFLSERGIMKLLKTLKD